MNNAANTSPGGQPQLPQLHPTMVFLVRAYTRCEVAWEQLFDGHPDFTEVVGSEDLGKIHEALDYLELAQQALGLVVRCDECREEDADANEAYHHCLSELMHQYASELLEPPCTPGCVSVRREVP